jgi:hypothetical protein
MPGFGPATEVVVWRVPKGETVIVKDKDAKPFTPRPVSFN